MLNPLDNVFNALFSFEDLAQDHSETSKIFLSSISRAMQYNTGSLDPSNPSPVNSTYFLSREWQKLFPSLLESLDKFDSLVTSLSRPGSIEQYDAATLNLDQHLTPVSSDSSGSCSLSSSSSDSISSSPETQSSVFSIASRILHAQTTTEGSKELDITPYLCMTQMKASQILRIRAQKLSSCWKMATSNRKWPFREVKRIDREISILIKNVEVNPLSAPLIEKLGKMLKHRELLLVPVKILI